ncbi:nucleotidyltransferase domain-containing protein [Kitasatospora kifunensis]|uniref:Polymerase nucleotidyl transferase domain-containing protein n=1 Tax=Kitasatospora kifunensis TaxID=58351 RepID=A0A7W7VY81_KITKI|nr:nucleotidyltransferase domain-containing protein [Kitasatospora kifunensis]MBB4926399.1 hypothetical protein [Kitasatospora kifunensis]
MNSHDLPLLLQRLAQEFTDVTGMSVVLSGSLARGDHRTGRSGRITSDLDLIPVVADETDAPAARAVLEPILQRLANAFQIEATAAITTLSAFRRAKHAPYRTSMRCQWLCDGLGLGPDAFTACDPNASAALPWVIQPVSYYLAKANVTDPQTNLVKARTVAARLVGTAGVEELPGTLDDLPRCLRNLIAERRLTPLDSTALYLCAPTRPGIALSVRDAVFIENQGLPFAASAVVVLPSSPN